LRNRDLAKLTGTPSDFVQWQGHDFSMRGMSSLDSAAKSGAAHLLSFTGTDTISGIDFLEEWYNANSDKELIGGSVPATEHSVMSAGGEINEFDTFRRLITEVYPSGVVSIVSDTWDFWSVLTNIAPSLKEEILARKPNAFGLAKVVFRPDSGDPVKIIAGYKLAPDNQDVFDIYDEEYNAIMEDGKFYEVEVLLDLEGSPYEINKVKELSEVEVKGAVQVLWEQFGGTHTSEGFKQVHERVGLIYGDSITPDRAARILKGLADKGFASGNIVFGIGSYTYQFNTRDTFGFAMKATWAVVNGIARELSKDPKTDNGNKKSAKGLLRVEMDSDYNFHLYDQQSLFEEIDGYLSTVFYDGKLIGEQSLADIRGNLWG
jgi:nicotinamide phosphoribosyltransferase